MKQILLLLLVVLFFNIDSNEAQTHAVGDGLVVAAHSGLRLRVNPGMKYPTITVLEFNDPVVVVQHDHKDYTLIDRVNWMDGYWVKVKSGHVAGWVFDGFLTSMQNPDHEDHLCLNCGSLVYPLERYITDNYLAECSEELADTTEDLYTSNVLYDNGIQVMKKIGEGWYQAEVVFEGHRMSEVLNLFRSMLVGQQARHDFGQSLIFHEDEAGYISKVEVKMFGDGLTIEQTLDGYVIVKAMVLTENPGYHALN